LPENCPQGDLILVSHEHSDHCSPDDIAKIRSESTVVVANPSAAAKLDPPVKILRPGESIELSGIEISAVPAYNTDKPFHPKAAEHVGYILTIAGEKLYFAGDTDHISEMKVFSCDVALLPVSGTYVMTAEEAAEAAEVISPRVAVPMHYGSGVVGTLEDALRFQELCSTPVLILQAEIAD
jgi:L-ascorbate metabolism protein UlaG (beta-lactamase superfamily)